MSSLPTELLRIYRNGDLHLGRSSRAPVLTVDLLIPDSQVSLGELEHSGMWLLYPLNLSPKHSKCQKAPFWKWEVSWESLKNLCVSGVREVQTWLLFHGCINKWWIERDDVYSKHCPGCRQVLVESMRMNFLGQVSQQWTPSEFSFQFFCI